MSVEATAVSGIPEVEPGADVAELIAAATDLRDGDVVVVAQKIVSKAEGRLRALADVEPREQARSIAERHGKDARLVQVVLDETRELLRADHGVLICATHHGWVCANAGVDLSNAADPDVAILLPTDPDASARRIRARLADAAGRGAEVAAPPRIGVVIADSFGRAWRLGVTDVAIGAAGIRVIEDWRGRADAHGRELRATEVAVADQLAAMADLTRRKDSQEPVVVIRGMAEVVIDADGPGATALQRPRELDLFR